MVNLETKLLDIVFSVGGYFKALAKIVDQGYGQHNSDQISYDKSEEQKTENADNQKQATYFALYALLEFIIHVQLHADKGGFAGGDNS